MTKHRESDSAEAGRGDAPIAPPYGPRPRGERVKSLYFCAQGHDRDRQAPAEGL